jgi:cytosine/adenosine deaminase-related metal-dependent hydrolase
MAISRFCSCHGLWDHCYHAAPDEGGASPAANPAWALPQRKTYLIRRAHILTIDPALGDFPAGDILVRDGAIAEVAESIEAPDAEIIDGRGMIALPGFVDTHWHLWNASLRGLVRADDPQSGYFPVTLKLGPHCSPEDARCSVRLGIAEALASGITTVHDWSHNIRSPNHADAEVAALRSTGIRALFSYGWGQDLALVDPMNLDDLGRVQRGWSGDGGLLTLGAALRTPVSNPRGIVPVDVLQKEFEGVRRLGLPITMHARPGVVSVLGSHGMLGPDVQLVHPQGVSASEIERLAQTRTRFSCSPVIEMHYAQAARGEIQFHELDEAGVRQSLSIDSSAASANADFFACMRALLWSHKQRFGASKPLPPKRLRELATLDGARDLGIDDRTGSITPGKRADIILVRTGDINMAPVFEPYFALVYSAQPSNVDTVMVDGRILRRKGEFTALDAGQIVHEATQSVTALAACLRT